MKDKILRYGLLLVGLLLAAFAYEVFLVPNSLAAGGVGGIAIVVQNLTGLSISSFLLIANVVLIVVSFIFLGKESTFKTILGSLLYPMFVGIIEKIVPYIDLSSMDLLVQSLVGGVIGGFGYGFIYKTGFTTGGTDIINQIVSRYFHMSMGNSILIVDGIVVICGGIFFGIEKMVYAIIILILMSVFSNKAMLGIGKNKTMYILTTHFDEVKDFLIANYYDATIIKVQGGYLNDKQKMIMCVIANKDYYMIKEGIMIIDSNAFITITDSYEAINKNVMIRRNG